MDIDVANGESNGNTPTSVLHLKRGPPTARLGDRIFEFIPQKLFRTEDATGRDGKSATPPQILSLDFDDPSDMLMTSQSDETIQLYSVKEGKLQKTLLSKKYGVKLAKFTHHSASIIYASTKQNDAIRYLTTHNNSFIRYFEGHTAAVTSITMHPGGLEAGDQFISSGKDDTVHVWDTRTKNYAARLYLTHPWLTAYDPSGSVFAVGCPSSGSILLFDRKNFESPFAVFDILEAGSAYDPIHVTKDWTTLAFSNDGKHILLGTKGKGHFLLDAFDGKLKAFLIKPNGNETLRLAPGETPEMSGKPTDSLESSGDVTLTPDGRFVLGGGKANVSIWDLTAPLPENKVLAPAGKLEHNKPTAVIAFSPRYNHLATADTDLTFWLPEHL